MADHGRVINSRTYWTTTDAKGKQVVVDKPPGGSSTPLGIGSTTPAATQYQEQTHEDGTKVLSRWDPEANQWQQESIEVDAGIASQYERAQKDPTGTQAQRDATAAETQRHNRVIEAQGANAASRQASTEARLATNQSRQLTMQERAAEAETKWRDLNADVAKGNLTLAQRNQTFKEYQQSVENDIAKSKLAIDQAAEGRMGQTAAASIANQGRQTTLGEAEFGRGVGRDAMSAAEKRYGYQREQAYARAKAAGKSPEQAINESAQTDIPDFDAIAAEAARRAVEGLRGLGTPAAAAAAPAGAPPPVPAAAAAVPTNAARAVAPAAALPSDAIPYPQPGGSGVIGRFGQ